jgi:indole-3-glycerol phosphate synthase
MSGGLLGEMARSSAGRVRAARAREGESSLLHRALAVTDPPAFAPPAPGAFALIAEFKRVAPSQGSLLETTPGQVRELAATQARLYARAGAAAISVLTEPSRFGGSLEDLETSSSAVDVPVMRKDFLVDPYQVLEARAAGASGVLVIVRMLDDRQLAELLDTAAELDLFVLAESFDARDVERCCRAIEGRGGAALLAGVNVRDLETLEVDAGRLAELAPLLPAARPRVAESGILGPGDAARASELGYDLALVGSALMRAHDPAALAAEMLAAACAARERA